MERFYFGESGYFAVRNKADRRMIDIYEIRAERFDKRCGEIRKEGDFLGEFWNAQEVQDRLIGHLEMLTERIPQQGVRQIKQAKMALLEASLQNQRLDFERFCA